MPISCGSMSWLINQAAFCRLRAHILAHILVMFSNTTVEAACPVSLETLTVAAGDEGVPPQPQQLLREGLGIDARHGRSVFEQFAGGVAQGGYLDQPQRDLGELWPAARGRRPLVHPVALHRTPAGAGRPAGLVDGSPVH